MWKKLAKQLLQNPKTMYIWCALASFGAVCGVPLVMWIAVICVGLMTLEKGWQAGLQVLLWALTPLLALAVVHIDVRQLLSLQLLMVWPLAWAWRSAIGNLQRCFWLCLVLALLIATGLHAYIGSHPVQFWHAWLHRSLPLNLPGMWGTPDKEQTKQLADMLQTFAPYLAGVIASSLMLSALLAVGFARSWQLRQRGQYLRNELCKFRVKASSLCWPLCVLAVLSLLLWRGSMLLQQANAANIWLYYHAWLWDIMPVWMLFYALLGLVVVHTLCTQSRWRIWWMCIIYAALFIVPNYAVLGLFVFALVDSFFNFRARLSAANS